MTGKEKCLASLSGSGCATPPVYAFISNASLVESLTGKKLGDGNDEEILAQAYSRCVDTTRQLLDDIFILYQQDELITDSYGYVHRMNQFTQWIESRPWSDMEGMAGIISRQIEDMGNWMPENNKGNSARYQYCENLTGGRVMLMGRAYVGTAPGSYFRDGLDNWSYFIADYPELAQEWVHVRHEMNLRRIKAYANPDTCPIEHMDADVAGKNGLLVSPAFLKNSGWFNRLSELVDCYHQAGIKIVFHSDGDIRSILSDLVATGIDGLNPIDTSAGMTLAATRRMVGPDIVLVGGIDSKILSRGDRADVKKHIREQVEVMKNTPWWLAPSTEEFDESMPVDNILTLLDIAGR